MRLRDVELGDVEAYARMRCDPVMMAELGGPLPREGIEAKVRSDVASAAADASWIRMIVPDESAPETVAGSVALWSHEDDGEPISEIGWMVLPEFQGRGLAKRAVRALLEHAQGDGRWGVVHAFPAVTNGPSNGICRSLGFTLRGEEDVRFADRVIHANHWSINPREDLPEPAAVEDGPLKHGYTNQTVRHGAVVVKTYRGPDAKLRLEREHGLLRRLHGRLPLPPVRRRDSGSLTVGFVTGVAGQDLLDAGHAEAVLAACGRLLRQIHGIDGAALDDLDMCDTGSVLVHGDYGPNNVLVNPVTFQVTAVVDWEFAGVGEPVEDLAWCEWIVRMHHPGRVEALDRFFDAYGDKPSWAARKAAMLDKCGKLERFCQRWEPDGPAVRQWQDRAALTARWRE